MIEIKGALWHIKIIETGDTVTGNFIYSPAGSGSSVHRYEGICFGKRLDNGAYWLVLQKGNSIDTVLVVNPDRSIERDEVVVKHLESHARDLKSKSG